MTITAGPRRVVLVLLAVVVVTAFYLVGAARSGGTPDTASAVGRLSSQPTTTTGAGITVVGSSAVTGTPDTLRLDLSVSATATTVAGALAKANGSADAVQKSLLSNGVARKDLQTSGLRISPSYDYPKGGKPRLSGYEVSESVSAKLRDLGRAGDAMGKAIAAGGNSVQVNGISLDLEDTGALVSRARDRSFADARTKAQQYAKAAGRPLAAVVSISEAVANTSPIPVNQASLKLEGSSSVPIQPGSQSVGVTVTVVFAMG